MVVFTFFDVLAIWDRFGMVLGRFWEALGNVLGRFWEAFGKILVRVGRISGRFGKVFLQRVLFCFCMLRGLDLPFFPQDGPAECAKRSAAPPKVGAAC